MMSTPAGMSDAKIEVPRLYLPLVDPENVEYISEFCKNRNSHPLRHINGIGIYQMAVPDTYQDPVVLGANAVDELMERNNLDSREIYGIGACTESSEEMAKSITTDIIRALEKKYGKGTFKNCAGPETKSACSSTSFGLENALDRIWAGREPDEVSIVVGTDFCNYDFKSKAKATEGRGAVAILVEPNPEALEFDKIIAHYTNPEPTFYRPSGSPVPIIDGDGSLPAYLTGIRGAVDHYRLRALKQGNKLEDVFLDNFGLASLHQPSPKTVKYGIAELLINDYKKLPVWEDISTIIGVVPLREHFVNDKSFQKEMKNYRKKFMDLDVFEKSFNEKVDGGQDFGSRIGNFYTGSIWAHLMGLLSKKVNKKEKITEKKGVMLFFGSGSNSAAMSYNVLPGCENVVKSFNLKQKLDDRIPICYDDYVALCKGEHLSGGREFILEPENEFVLTKIENGYRHYNYV